MRNLTVAFVLCMLGGTAASAPGSLQAVTETGILKGAVDDGTRVFRGIPYAAPPVNDLRWRPPQPAGAWQGTRVATRNGHACPQPLGKYPGWADAATLQAGMDEDCLYLNIWAPADAGTNRYPVMVYFHGGNMQYGSNALPLYRGNVLARNGVVIVFVNYRLGYLGRFGHPALTRLQRDEPLVNYGLMDQIAALQWVQRNIAAFGGDPDNVTIFGHSAGGVSVNFLMVTPASKGLFHKAIAQGSGVLLDRNQHAFERLDRGLTGLSSEDIGLLLADYFDVPAGSDAEVAAALRAIPPESLVAYQEAKQKPFNPVVDGKLVPDHIAQIFERGEQHDVPYMGGANSWEWNQIADIPLVGKWFLGGALIEGLSDDDLAAFDDQWTRIGLSQRWFAEGLFLSSTRYLAKQMANVSSPAWHYHVTYVQTGIRGEVPGAGHGVEVPAIFGNLAEHPEHQRPEAAAAFAPSTEDLAWADTVRAYWLNFAKMGDPNGPDVPAWPEYAPETDLTLELGEAIRPVSQLNKASLDYLEERALIRRAQFDAGDAGG